MNKDRGRWGKQRVFFVECVCFVNFMEVLGDYRIWDSY